MLYWAPVRGTRCGLSQARPTALLIVSAAGPSVPQPLGRFSYRAPTVPRPCPNRAQTVRAQAQQDTCLDRWCESKVDKRKHMHDGELAMSRTEFIKDHATHPDAEATQPVIAPPSARKSNGEPY